MQSSNQAVETRTTQARCQYTSAEIAPSLGRQLSSCPATGACTATTSISLLPPNTMFEDRFSQADIRFTKNIRLQKLRVQGQFDVYNLFNSSAVLAENGTYGSSWLRPSSILAARLFKFGAQVDWK